MGNPKARHTCGTSPEDAWECAMTGLLFDLKEVVQEFRQGKRSFKESERSYHKMLKQELNKVNGGQTKDDDMIKVYAGLVKGYVKRVLRGKPLHRKDKTKLAKILKKLENAEHNNTELMDLVGTAQNVMAQDADLKEALQWMARENNSKAKKLKRCRKLSKQECKRRPDCRFSKKKKRCKRRKAVADTVLHVDVETTHAVDNFVP